MGKGSVAGSEREKSDSLKKHILDFVVFLEDKIKFVEAYCVPFFFYRIAENNYDKDEEKQLLSLLGTKLPIYVTIVKSLCTALETTADRFFANVNGTITQQHPEINFIAQRETFFNCT